MKNKIDITELCLIIIAICMVITLINTLHLQSQSKKMVNEMINNAEKGMESLKNLSIFNE